MNCWCRQCCVIWGVVIVFCGGIGFVYGVDEQFSYSGIHGKLEGKDLLGLWSRGLEGEVFPGLVKSFDHKLIEELEKSRLVFVPRGAYGNDGGHSLCINTQIRVGVNLPRHIDYHKTDEAWEEFKSHYVMLVEEAIGHYAASIDERASVVQDVVVKRKYVSRSQWSRRRGVVGRHCVYSKLGSGCSRSRRKRGAAAGIAVVGAIAVMSGGLSIYSAVRHEQLRSDVNGLARRVGNLEVKHKFLEESIGDALSAIEINADAIGKVNEQVYLMTHDLIKLKAKVMYESQVLGKVKVYLSRLSEGLRVGVFEGRLSKFLIGNEQLELIFRKRHESGYEGLVYNDNPEFLYSVTEVVVEGVSVADQTVKLTMCIPLIEKDQLYIYGELFGIGRFNEQKSVFALPRVERWVAFQSGSTSLSDVVYFDMEKCVPRFGKFMKCTTFPKGFVPVHVKCMLPIGKGECEWDTMKVGDQFVHYVSVMNGYIVATKLKSYRYVRLSASGIGFVEDRLVHVDHAIFALFLSAGEQVIFENGVKLFGVVQLLEKGYVNISMTGDDIVVHHNLERRILEENKEVSGMVVKSKAKIEDAKHELIDASKDHYGVWNHLTEYGWWVWDSFIVPVGVVGGVVFVVSFGSVCVYEFVGSMSKKE